MKVANTLTLEVKAPFSARNELQNNNNNNNNIIIIIIIIIRVRQLLACRELKTALELSSLQLSVRPTIQHLAGAGQPNAMRQIEHAVLQEVFSATASLAGTNPLHSSGR